MEAQGAEARVLPSFDDRPCSVMNFLPPAHFGSLQSEILTLAETERTYIPAHKKGATIGYDVLRKSAPNVVALYRNPQYQKLISRIVGVHVEPTPIQDNSSLSILIYDRPGDHIGWHYDHNFYRGRHFTVLIGVENANRERTALSGATLLVKKRAGAETENSDSSQRTGAF